MLKLARGRERAQVIVVAALLIPVLLGMTGMAIDIGTYANHRRDLQNAADSIALAAAQSLPNSSAAAAAAETWAENNGVEDEYTLTVSGGTVSPTARVVISDDHDFSFIRVLGIESRSVGAVASAGKFSFGGAAGVVPWSITQATVDQSAPGTLVTIKYDSNGGSNGNFGAIRIDGDGASDYEEAAKYGSTAKLCAINTSGCTTAGCPGTYPTACAETAPECDGAECQPKTGNMTGPTKDAVDFRTLNTSSNCNSFDEVFTQVTVSTDQDEIRYAVAEAGAARVSGKVQSRPNKPDAKPKTDTPTPTPTATSTNTPTATATKTNTPVVTNTPAATNTAGPSPTPPPSSTPQPTNTAGPSPTPVPLGEDRFSLNPNCNPWNGPGACPAAPADDDCSRRVIIIPVIDGFGNGSSDPVTIQRFALLYLEGYEGSCTGNSCDIKARFVNAQLTTGAIAGAYDEYALIQFTKLTE
jgi:Flp pilus assembly protein TadG